MALIRKDSLYEQLANEVRALIASGELGPGAKLPSEAEMTAQFQVSRQVVRQAIAALRAEGLITVHHGKGAFVRASSGPKLIWDRTAAASEDDWHEAERPSGYRTTTDATTAALLEMSEGEAAFGTDRLITHAPTGVRALHRQIIPFATADGTALETTPHASPKDAYAALTAASHTLTWHEHVGARMPTPDEASALTLSEGVPLLVITRITSNEAGPVMVEEVRVGADAVQAAYPLTVTTAERRPGRSV